MLMFKEDIRDEEVKLKLQAIIPPFRTSVIKYVGCENSSDYTCHLRCAIKKKDEALEWLKTFQELTFTTYHVDKCYEEETLKTVFKKRYHCLHNTRPKTTTKNPHQKHTKCKATLTINVKRDTMQRSRDPYLKEYPCDIQINSFHNHPILAADSLRHRQPKAEVCERIRSLFNEGHSPASAYELFQIELQDTHGDDYYRIAGDGHECPTRKWCYDLYYKLFKQEYGDPTGPEMISSLQTMIDQYNKDCGEICASMVNDNDHLVVALCSPLMKRINEGLKTAGEIIFMDSSGNMDRHNSRIFLLICPSIIGGLPLGIMMTYSETEIAITKALQLLKNVMGPVAFHHGGQPNVVITDDCTAERNSLSNCFPKSTLLLCKFHVLQNVMRFLWDSKHGVGKDDRVAIYNMFRQVMDCDSEDAFHRTFNDCLLSEPTTKYKRVVDYLESLRHRANEWAMCFRQSLMTRGNNTNNYVESAFRVLKDKILHRTKAFSIVQMFDYLTTNFMQYYKRKILNVVNNRTEGRTKSKYYVDETKISNFEVIQISTEMFSVNSNENVYIVDMTIEVCSCYKGRSGAPCKHQYAVAKKFGLSTLQFVPDLDVCTRKLFWKIATGQIPENNEWFQNLHPSNAHEAIKPAMSEQTEKCEDEASNAIVLKSQTYDTATLKTQLAVFMNNLNEALDNSPEAYYQPIKQFVDMGLSLRTDASLVSALCTFGKYTGGGMPLVCKGKNLQGGSVISVQPTAVSRRKRCTGSRKASSGGRPPKSERLEHPYSKRKHNFPDVHEAQGRAPHSLTYKSNK